MYIDRLAMMAVRRMDKKDWREAPFDPVFKEIVRFQQLTMSGGYSESEFEHFYDGFKGKASEAYGEDSVDDERISDAYRMLARRTGTNAAAAASEFSKRPGLDYLKKGVWSGNLTHELIGLPDRGRF